MFERIFARPSIRNLHERSPMLAQREQYLKHIEAMGRARNRLQNAATEMLHVVRLLHLDSFRMISEEEIKEAATAWASEEEPHRAIKGNKSSTARFTYTARRWLHHQGMLRPPPQVGRWFDEQLHSFTDAISLRLAERTIDHYVRRTKAFLTWVSKRKSSLGSINIQDVDDYIKERRDLGFRPATLTSECQVLRTFFNHARAQGWCEANFIRSIRNPVPRRYRFTSRGPSWQEVRRLLDSVSGRTVADLRAKAVLLICAIYGLRNGEVTALTLDDFDWLNETMTVRRTKSGRTQRFPIQYEVGQAIIRYLKYARPKCGCRNLFVSQHAPYRPLRTVWPIIGGRMKQANILSEDYGSHALRHSCAMQLLHKGTPLHQLADYLGHRSLDSVKFYARHDTRSLSKVANFSLEGVL